MSNTTPNKAAIEQALAILMAEGKKSFVVGYSPTESEALAMAISQVRTNPVLTMEIAANHAEDWNWHDEAKEIRAIAKRFQS